MDRKPTVIRTCHLSGVRGKHLTTKARRPYNTALHNKLLTCIIFPFSPSLKYVIVPRNDRDYFIKRALKYEYIFVDEIYFNNTEYYIEILTNYYHYFF